MNICQFCQRSFKNRQGFVAHSKSCSKYKKAKAQQKAPNSSTAKELQRDGLGTDSNKRAVHQPHPDDPMAAFKTLLGESAHSSTGARSASLASRRRLLLQQAKQQAIDSYFSPKGTVTSAMRGEARKAIEVELSKAPLEEFSETEIVEWAFAVRDKTYAPYFRQEQEAHEWKVTQERECLEQLMVEQRTSEQHAHRKALWWELARPKIIARCDQRGISSGARLNLELLIEKRLQMILVGSESEQKASKVIEFVINQQFQILDERKSARVAQKRQKLIEQVGDVVIGLTPLAMSLGKPFLEKGMAWVAGKVGVSTPPTPDASAQERSTGAEQTGQPHSPSNDQPGTNFHANSSHTESTGSGQNQVPPFTNQSTNPSSKDGASNS